MAFLYDFTYRGLEGRELDYEEIDDNHRAMGERVAYVEQVADSHDPLKLAQTTGNSTTESMSQWAITQALGKVQMSGANIKAAYEQEANAYTDAKDDKLSNLQNYDDAPILQQIGDIGLVLDAINGE